MAKSLTHTYQKNVYHFFSIVIILVGIFLRLRQFLFNRSLWLDEAALALNIINRNYSSLLGLLNDNQAAPIGFLFGEKFITRLIDNSEFSLRLLPFLCGIGAMVLFYLLAKRILSPSGTLLATSLFATNPELVYYSSEVKQYIIDVFICILVLYLMPILFSPNSEGKKRYLIGLGIAALIWFSHPIIFLLIGVIGYHGVKAIVNKDRDLLKRTITITGSWLLSFTMLYFVSLRNISSNERLNTYWSIFFAPLIPRFPLAFINWYKSTLVEFIQNPGGIQWPWIGLILVMIGFVWFYKHQKTYLYIFGIMLLGMIFASGFEKYPLFGRMLLFLVPFLDIFVASGLTAIISNLHTHKKWVSTLLMFALLLFWGWKSVEYFKSPRTVQEIRPILEEVSQNLNQEDKVFVYSGSKLAFEYYQPQFPVFGSNVFFSQSSRSNPEAYIDQIEPFLEVRRVWFIFSHVHINADNIDERQFILDYLNEKGTILIELTQPGTWAYLFEFPKSSN